ncbi:hypothetical protein PybrP1_008381 [[Pythium] brassicae (nom. inval.)]|nr:hypothetical protein PybrP1_008381 [[Pythium] brassicae (nom. inval.)]
MAGGGVIVNNNNDYDDLPTEGSKTYAIIVCVFASLGGLFFGYDQGVTSAVLIMDSFLEDFCVGWHGFTWDTCRASVSSLPEEWTDFTLWYNMAYNIGCIFGALLGGFVADKFGRRWTIFTAGRVIIAMCLQVLQQATGINPIFSYGGLIFKDVTNAARAAIVFTAGCDGNVDDAGCSTGAGYVIVLGSSFFVFNFAISWGPVCWIYPPEIFPMKVRARAVSLSTMANWLMGVAMTYVVKLFPDLNINGVFFLFAGTCLISGVFVYFLCPETKGIALEEIEYLFHPGSKRPAASPKYVEVETPVQNV